MKRLLVFFFLALSSTSVYCQTTDNASLLVDIDVDLDIDLDGQILRISSEEVRKGYVLVISLGNAFEERYFLNPEPMLNTYELLLWGAGGGNAFNEDVMESGFYEECFGEKYGEVTFKKGSLKMTFLPQCNSFIAPFYISVKI